MPKHEPTDSYFYLARQLAKCTMRSYALNSDNYPVRTEMTATKNIPTSYVCSMDERKLKEFPVDKTSFADLFHRRGRIKRHHRQ